MRAWLLQLAAQLLVARAVHIPIHRTSILRSYVIHMVESPSTSLTPVEVVEAQLDALKRGDVKTCFEFASPNNKRATGPWQVKASYTTCCSVLLDLTFACARTRFSHSRVVSRRDSR